LPQLLSMRACIAAFALLSFFLSSFVTQTHIHLTSLSKQGTGALAVADSVQGKEVALSQSRDRSSPALPDDPAHCPFCQEFLVAGSYVAPAPIAIPLPIQAATALPLMAETVSVIQAVSHGWRGRGPPLG